MELQTHVCRPPTLPLLGSPAGFAAISPTDTRRQTSSPEHTRTRGTPPRTDVPHRPLRRLDAPQCLAPVVGAPRADICQGLGSRGTGPVGRLAKTPRRWVESVPGRGLGRAPVNTHRRR